MKNKYFLLFILQLLFIPLSVAEINTNWDSYNEIGDINNCITWNNLEGLIITYNCNFSYGSDIYLNQTITKNDSNNYYTVKYHAVGSNSVDGSFLRTRIYINDTEVKNIIINNNPPAEEFNDVFYFPNGTYKISLRFSFIETGGTSYIPLPCTYCYINIDNYTVYNPDSFHILSWGNTYTNDENLKFYVPNKGTVNFNLTTNKNITYADSIFYINGVSSYNLFENPYLYNFYSFNSGIYNITTVVKYNNETAYKTWYVYYGLYPKISGYIFYKDSNNIIHTLSDATINLNSTLTKISDANGYYIFSFEGDIYNPDYSNMPVINTVYNLKVSKNNTLSEYSDTINYNDIFDVAYRNYTLLTLSNKPINYTDDDIITYFWDILFIACVIYGASFIITLGDKK